MGNSVTVRNDTTEEVQCEVYPAGSKELTMPKRIPANEKEIFSFGIISSKTFIVCVNGKAVRAVSKNRRACLKQILVGEFIIVTEHVGIGILASSEEILENYNKDINWNIVKDVKVKEDVRNRFTENFDFMVELNKHISSVCGMVLGSGVAQITGNKDAARIATKILSDFFTNYLKVPVTQLKSKEDPFVKFKIREIYQTLIAISRSVSNLYPYLKETISRSVSNLYPYLKETIGDDNKALIMHLQELMSKITTTNIFPFLEQCGLEVAVPIYLFAITIVMDIIDRIKEISLKDFTEAERNFVEVFVNNLKEIWNSVLESIPLNCAVKVKGCCVKKATLSYNGDFIYCVKSISKNKAECRLKNIKEEFIRNKRYQLDFLYGHPIEVVKRFEEKVQAKK